MVRLLARIVGVGVETADMLVREVLSLGRRQRARRAVSGHSFLCVRVRCLTARKARLAIAQGRQLALRYQPLAGSLMTRRWRRESAANSSLETPISM